jgi:CRISPR-associated endoribonuclease Cas6
MLVAAVVRVVATTTVAPLPFLGRALHAIALDLLRAQDPALAAGLHAEDRPKPFTASGPYQPATGRLVWRLQAGEEYWLRFTALEGRTARALRAGLAALPADLRLDTALVRVAGVEETVTDYPVLLEAYLRGGPVDRSLTLQFLTPTAFHSGGKTVPVPLPDLVFGSLLERWNQYAPATLSPDAREFARTGVGIAHYDLRAWALTVGGGKQVVFSGRCGYRVLRYDPYWTRVLQLLARFAVYAGVGIKTGMGMGQVRPEEPRDGGAVSDRTGQPAAP